MHTKSHWEIRNKMRSKFLQLWIDDRRSHFAVVNVACEKSRDCHSMSETSENFEALWLRWSERSFEQNDVLLEGVRKRCGQIHRFQHEQEAFRWQGVWSASCTIFFGERDLGLLQSVRKLFAFLNLGRFVLPRARTDGRNLSNAVGAKWEARVERSIRNMIAG